MICFFVLGIPKKKAKKDDVKINFGLIITTKFHFFEYLNDRTLFLLKIGFSTPKYLRNGMIYFYQPMIIDKFVNEAENQLFSDVIILEKIVKRIKNRA